MVQRPQWPAEPGLHARAISLSASLKVDDVSLDNFLGGWLRGYTEFFFRGDYEQIVHGPENHVESFIVGPRYNFVQPGWKLIPYAEGGVGISFADSNPQWGRLGQDFNFTFTVGAGAKYLISDDWFVRAGRGISARLQRRPFRAGVPESSDRFARAEGLRRLFILDNIRQKSRAVIGAAFLLSANLLATNGAPAR